jgi:hypothetical protein
MAAMPTCRIVSAMTDVSLRELFEQLIRDPATRTEFMADQAGFFEARGFGDLDDPLMAEAITNVVAGFPPDVAEHFSEFTVAASPVPHDPGSDDPGSGDPGALDLGDAFDLLGSAPAWPELEVPEPEVTELGPEDAADEPSSEAMNDFGSGAGDDLGVGLADPGLGIDDDVPAGSDAGSDLADDLVDVDPLADLAGESADDPSSFDPSSFDSSSFDPMDLDEIKDPGDLEDPGDPADGVIDG